MWLTNENNIVVSIKGNYYSTFLDPYEYKVENFRTLFSLNIIYLKRTTLGG